MKKLLLLLFLVVCSACELFQTKKVSSEEILIEESQELNWHEVDQYPAFSECREILEEVPAKDCFGNKVASYVYARLEEKEPVVTEALHDTIMLHLIVSDSGKPLIDSVEIDSIVLHHLPKIKTWVQESIESLPKIYPASKRGIPVATKFKLPIVIEAE